MKTRSTRLLGTSCLMALSVYFQPGEVRAESLIDVCSGLSVDVPVLNQVANTANGLLGGLLDPVLNAIVGNVNVNVVDALGGKNIGATVRDKNGNLVTAPGDCGLSAKSVEIDSTKGISIGAGKIDGLGAVGGTAPVANDANAIAMGTGAVTGVGAENALAIGLRGSVTATDGVALGRDANVSTAGGIALGSDSVANRAGMNGSLEAFSNVAVASTRGALSIGSAGGERQITNVAGGTADTDAVNVRQLRAVDDKLATTEVKLRAADDSLAAAFGGGASFDSTTGIFTGPRYTLRGTVYTDVGSALAGLEATNSVVTQSGVISGNNAAGAADALATGANALSAGFGSTASGGDSAAYGADATASGDRSTALGAHSVASGNNATAVGAGATATRDNQVAIGTASSTYTMPGIDSNASRAAQQGPTRIVTSDASGNLATSDIDLGGLTNDVSSLKRQTSDLQRESRRGIAAAMAMAAAVTPSGPGKTAWAANMATYHGEVAGSFSLAHTLDLTIPVTLNGAVSVSPGTSPGVRVGLAGEF
ncbi:hypothetical protein [Rhizobium sp. PL01]|uniref:hypothetical protein n=1 Tax=Rhizobium sp. PL01 TaxID=3085631 RepID=UPI002981290A|nr:hypothetical protein [Rhizobium sp. PL01]MDW5314364.1 hypothetical protein [Rhizobium sp. PL01]